MLDYQKTGKRIRAARKAAGLSQEELAEKIWISVTHMSHIETGSTKLSLPVLVDIAGALNVSTDSLLFDEEKLTKSDAVNQLSLTLDKCTKDEILLINEIARTVRRFDSEKA